MKKRTQALLMTLCAIILVVATVAGTMAYLTASTTKVTNTFTAGDGLFTEPEGTPQPTLNPEDPKPNFNGLHLLESNIKTLDDGSYETDEGYCYGNSYTVLPGMELPKDPTVFVVGKSDVPGYLFIEVVDGLDNSDAILTYSIDTTVWTELTGANGAHDGTVYVYNNGEMLTSDKEVGILTGSSISVAAEATKEEIEDAFASGIDFYACMAQCAGFDDAVDAYNTCFGKAA